MAKPFYLTILITFGFHLSGLADISQIAAYHLGLVDNIFLFSLRCSCGCEESLGHDHSKMSFHHKTHGSDRSFKHGAIHQAHKHLHKHLHKYSNVSAPKKASSMVRSVIEALPCGWSGDGAAFSFQSLTFSASSLFYYQPRVLVEIITHVNTNLSSHIEPILSPPPEDLTQTV